MPTVNSIIVPVGGGGVLAGVAVAAKNTRHDIEVLGVQPETVAAMYHSLKAGKITNVEMKVTIADGLSGNIEKGCITFELIQRYVDEILLFNEDTIRKVIRLLWEKERQVVEGSGAISIAPLVEAPKRFTGKQTVAVITGGNIDDVVFQNILTSGT